MPLATLSLAAVPEPLNVNVSPPCRASNELRSEPAAFVVPSYCLASVALRGR